MTWFLICVQHRQGFMPSSIRSYSYIVHKTCVKKTKRGGLFGRSRTRINLLWKFFCVKIWARILKTTIGLLENLAPCVRFCHRDVATSGVWCQIHLSIYNLYDSLDLYEKKYIKKILIISWHLTVVYHCWSIHVGIATENSI